MFSEHFIAFWGIITSTVYLLGFLHAAHAIFSVRSSKGAIAWTISLITFPWVAVPFYWVFGRNKFVGYVKARRAGKFKIDDLAGKVTDSVNKHAAEFPENLPFLCNALKSLVSLPCTNGNSAELLVDGKQAFTAMIQCIRNAKRYVIVQYFIVEDGALAGEYKRLLGEAAEKGVKVYFMYDEIGSRCLSGKYIHELREAGVDITAFHSTRGFGNQFQINFRNHRKVTIVDGKTAFVGGLNLGDAYLSCDPRMGHWRDTHVKIEGPSVQCVQLPFVEDWFWATGKIPDLNWETVPAENANRKLMIIPSGPADDIESFQLFVLSLINSASKRLWIASPYFVPDTAVVAALKLAALRGVDVRIMMPDKPDHFFVYLAGFSYYKEMLDAGVRLYRYREGFMHQKVMLIDTDAATIGTANLDNRSFHLNFETTVLALDQSFAREVGEMLEADFAKCQEAEVEHFEKRNAFFRIAVHLSRLMSPIL